MKELKFTNPAARMQLKPGGNAPKILRKKSEAKPEERDYFPVMLELAQLLEKTHGFQYEDEISQRIKAMESADPESRLSNGVYWQDRPEGSFLLLDERSLRVYRGVLEEYLPGELLENLTNFLEQTNQKRRADYERASEEDKQAFKKIQVVTLTPA